MGKIHQNAPRKVGAHLCLLATLLLYAPLTALAWNVASMSCCDGDRCPLHHHHHGNTQKHDMDCGHESDEMSACSMECCHDSEKATLAAFTFVLPRPAIAADAVMITRAFEIPASSEIRATHEPLSPPPRISSVVL